jgi:hypothetical protein
MVWSLADRKPEGGWLKYAALFDTSGKLLLTNEAASSAVAGVAGSSSAGAADSAAAAASLAAAAESTGMANVRRSTRTSIPLAPPAAHVGPPTGQTTTVRRRHRRRKSRGSGGKAGVASSAQDSEDDTGSGSESNSDDDGMRPRALLFFLHALHSTLHWTLFIAPCRCQSYRRCTEGCGLYAA